MSTVTVNKIRYGVIKALSDHFDIEVFGEEIKGDLEPPCFFVKMFNTEHKQDLDRRYLRYNSFDIHYFGDTTNKDMFNILEELYETMELIEIDGNLYRGTSMKHEIIDQVLHFFVDYNFHVYKPKENISKMQSLEQEGFLKWLRKSKLNNK
ncbi:phage tail terminator family protein [Anaerophilus nitritogenes]|uniref:phage tail terminator family protein n=1 Tax=Anaerophilus nitritogenes TaxID=2498136 RepID=UPI00101BFB99|nr:hypothetical protein [Anaerophilus nitritogenes]